jgi:hypothetical protein
MKIEIRINGEVAHRHRLRRVAEKALRQHHRGHGYSPCALAVEIDEWGRDVYVGRYDEISGVVVWIPEDDYRELAAGFGRADLPELPDPPRNEFWLDEHNRLVEEVTP